MNIAMGMNDAAAADPDAAIVEGTKHDQQVRLLDLAIDNGLDKAANEEPIGIDTTGIHADTPVSAEEFTDVSTVAIRSASYMKANGGSLAKPAEAPKAAAAEADIAKPDGGCCVIS